jgi:hypothetical protein
MVLQHRRHSGFGHKVQFCKRETLVQPADHWRA